MTINITLPDGSVKEFAQAAVTGTEIAASIGAGLAKAAVAIVVDSGFGDTQQDLSVPITGDAKVRILTLKDPDGLEIARHTLTAQVLARAVKELFPSSQLAIGPTIENGFYYDIEFYEPLSADDLPKIEGKMRDILKTDQPIIRELWMPKNIIWNYEITEPILGAHYKSQIVESAVEKNELIDGKYLSIYRQEKSRIFEEMADFKDTTNDFFDLCRGPHADNLTKIAPLAFKLTHLAGAYWRGDSKNKQLTRIYGVAFATQKELDAYLVQKEEAEKRDHRRLGKELDLFHLQEEALGQPFWHPKGWSIFLELEHFIRQKLRAYDYQEVNTPKLVSKGLFEKSGHWQNYREDMFLVCDDVMQTVIEPAAHEDMAPKTLEQLATKLDELHITSLKPMNCPCHVQIFNQGSKSYRDLPLRMSEFGMCMRNEAHGALHGLLRVTSLTQDDAHIFCTPEQMEGEIIALCKLIDEVYEPLGFSGYTVKLATRPEKRVGEDSLWDASEKALADACAKIGIELTVAPGDGAFYGPKLEYHLRDAIGRTWQCGTVQVDFNTARRMGGAYTAEDGSRVAPVMIHRAILGTFERFIGMLIEQYEGKFPVWLAPVQAMVIPITDTQNDYAHEVRKKLRVAAIVTGTGGLRVEVDEASERMQKKILLAQQQKIPYMLVVGAKEAEAGTVAVRKRDGTDLSAMPLADFIARISAEVAGRKDAA